MALNPNRTSADFTFKHSGQPDEYGVSIGDYTEVQENLDSRAVDNLTDINNVKDHIRTDIATKEDLADLVIGEFGEGFVTPVMLAFDPATQTELNSTALNQNRVLSMGGMV